MSATTLPEFSQVTFQLHPAGSTHRSHPPVARRLYRMQLALPGAVRFVLASGLLCCVTLGIGLLAVHSPTMAMLAAIAVLAVGLATVDLSIVAVLAFPATLVMIRVGPLSVSDVILAAATVPCLLLMRWREAADLKPLIWLAIIYQALLLPTLLWNPYAANVIEWVHEAFLVSGSLIIGWIAGRYGHARTALNVYAFCCVGLAIAAMIFVAFTLATKGGPLQPAYLPFLHKNFIGNTLAYAFLIAFVRPSWLGWSKRVTPFLMLIFALGVAASQARQAVVSVVVAIVVLALRGRHAGTTKFRVLAVMLIPAAWVVVQTVRTQLALHDEFNSTSQRLLWFAQSIEIWKHSPLFGVGLRFWNAGLYGKFQPPNGLLEMLSSAGVLGLLGFIVLCTGALWVIFKLDPKYGNVALAVVVARFTQGELDIYWVAGQASFLWLITGLAYGLQALDLHRQRTRPEDPIPTEQRPRQMAHATAHGARWRLARAGVR